MSEKRTDKNAAAESSGNKMAMALSGVTALAVGVACGTVLWANTPAEGATTESHAQLSETVKVASDDPVAEAGLEAETATGEEHTHDWSPLTETIHHDAVTCTVNHPAEYEQQIAYHTICNECGEVLDNAAEQHIEATGHSGYTVNVPREETVLTKDEWSEIVVVQDAYDEAKVKGSICLSCGEVQRAITASSLK